MRTLKKKQSQNTSALNHIFFIGWIKANKKQTHVYVAQII